MRTFACSAALALIGALPVFGQDDAQSQLKAVLRSWENATGQLQTLHVDVERITDDKALGARDIHVGFALFAKEDKNTPVRARLKLVKKGNANVYEEYICAGAKLYEYAPASKVVRVHSLPKDKAGLPSQQTLLSFLFGISAKQLQAQYKMELDTKNPPDAYHYVNVWPVPGSAGGDFKMARLVIRRNDYLLAQIWYLERNGNQQTWNFTKPQVNLPLAPAALHPMVPQGWRMEGK